MRRLVQAEQIMALLHQRRGRHIKRCRAFRVSANARPSLIAFLKNALAVQLVLHGLGRGEGQLLGSCDLDHGTGRRIAALASRLILDLELAKAVQRNFVALRRGTGDRGEDAVDILTRVGLGQTMIGGQSFGEFSVVHNHLPFVDGWS